MSTNLAQVIGYEGTLLVIMGYLVVRCLQRRESISLKRFSRVVFGLTIFLIVDIPTRLNDLCVVDYPPIVVHILNSLYLITETFTIYEWFIYSETIQDTFFVKTKTTRRLCSVFVWAMAILCIASYFNHWLFYVDDSGHYQRGSLFILQMIFPYAYILVSMGSAVHATITRKNRRNVLLVSFGLVPAIVSSVLQIRFSGSFTIGGFVLALLFIYIEMCMEELKEIDNVHNIENLNKELILQQEKLIAANDEAEKARIEAVEANSAKSSFLARMSHDIRTPLNGIIGLIEIDDKHPDDIELITENRKKTKVAANHLLDLISDVLEISKMSDNNVSLAHEPFDMLELCKDVVTICEMRALESGITLTRTNHLKDGDNVYVFGSPLHIRRVVLNILGNCIKYNKENGSVNIDLSLESNKNNISTYKIVISDTGIGMSEEFLEHIFEPFTQASNDARSVYMGTGLGMAIVKAIVEKAGGTIEVTSELGVGSTFTLLLPFENATEADMPKHEEELICDISGMNILLVEDNELNMDIATSLLEDEDVNVTPAENGQIAYDLFKDNAPGTFDVIIMDLMMPVMDGLTATKTIRAYDREDAKTIPIIAMTANAFTEDADKCRAAGMNDHLAKPLNLKKLISTLAKYKK